MVNSQHFCVAIPQTHEENCGSQGEVCCSNDGCKAQNLVCMMGSCVACGELNNPTCPSALPPSPPPPAPVTDALTPLWPRWPARICYSPPPATAHRVCCTARAA